MANSQFIPVQISANLSLKEVKCISFSFSEYANNSKKSISLEKFEFNFNISIVIVSEEKLLTVMLDVTLSEKEDNTRKQLAIMKTVSKISEKEDNTRKQLAIMKTVSKISLENFEEIITKKVAGFLIPDPIITICAGIALSNARGMFAIKTEGTLYEAAIIPLIDPSNLLPKKPQSIF